MFCLLSFLAHSEQSIHVVRVLLMSDPITSTRNPPQPLRLGGVPITQPSTEQGGVDASLHVCLPSRLSGRQSLGPAQLWGHHQCWAPRMTGYNSTGALGPFPAHSPLPHPEPWFHGALSSVTVSCFKIDSGHFLKCLWNLKNDRSRCVLAFCHFVCLKNVPFAGIFVV